MLATERAEIVPAPWVNPTGPNSVFQATSLPKLDHAICTESSELKVVAKL